MDLPWGERVNGTPLIRRAGIYYLQCIVLAPGQSTYFMGSIIIPPEQVSSFVPHRFQGGGQGLEKGNEVIVHCYALDNITSLRLMNQEIEDEHAPRLREPVLGIKA